MGGGKGRNKKMDDGSPDLVGRASLVPSTPARWTVFVRCCPPSIFVISFYFCFISSSFLSPPSAPCKCGSWLQLTSAEGRSLSMRMLRRAITHHGFSSSNWGDVHVTVFPSKRGPDLPSSVSLVPFPTLPLSRCIRLCPLRFPFPPRSTASDLILVYAPSLPRPRRRRRLLLGFTARFRLGSVTRLMSRSSGTRLYEQ